VTTAGTGASPAPGAGPTALGDLTAAPGPATGLVAEVAVPSPSPSGAPAGGFEPWEVSPGLLGFVPVFLIALACVGLFLSLTRQMRKVTVRQAMRDADDAAALREGGLREAPGDGSARGDGSGGPAGPAAPAGGDRPGDGPTGRR
jgi:hypothetical protein